MCCERGSDIIIIIIMNKKVQVCFLFLDPQNEVSPSISSSVVLCFFVQYACGRRVSSNGGITVLNMYNIYTLTLQYF
jgi:hypothetical protein